MHKIRISRRFLSLLLLNNSKISHSVLFSFARKYWEKKFIRSWNYHRKIRISLSIWLFYFCCMWFNKKRNFNFLIAFFDSLNRHQRSFQHIRLQTEICHRQSPLICQLLVTFHPHRPQTVAICVSRPLQCIKNRFFSANNKRLIYF